MKKPNKQILYTAFTYQKPKVIDKTFEFISSAQQVHGLRYDYSQSNYNGCHGKLKVICHHHGAFFISPTTHIHQKYGCPYCGNSRFTPELFLKMANDVHMSKYKYHDVELIQYRGAMDYIKIECLLHGIYYQRLDSHLRGNGCPECVDRPYNHSAEIKYKTQKLSILQNNSKTKN